MAVAEYNSFINELGENLNLTLKADETSFISLQLSESLSVNIQYVEFSDSIYIFYELGKLDPLALHSTAVTLLKANLFGMETGGGTLALQEDSNIVVFSYSAPLILGNTRLIKIFENTINYAQHWQREIAKANEELTKKELWDQNNMIPV